MTAEVVIMNKRGVAIAADSATTTQIGHKVVKITTATNKIEMISASPAIAMLHSGRSAFNDIPWSLIVSEFRKKYTKPWVTMELCTRTFLDYLANCPIDPEASQKCFIEFIVKKIYNRHRNLVNSPMEQMEAKLQEELDEIQAAPLFYGMQGEFNIFDDNALNCINAAFDSQEKESNQLFGPFLGKAKSLAYQALKHICSYNRGNFTEIAFAGYGEHDFFPSTYRYRIYGALGKTLVYTIAQPIEISLKRIRAVIPLAQKDEMQSFFNGVNPDVDNYIQKDLENTSSNLKTKMLNLIKKYADRSKVPECDIESDLNSYFDMFKDQFLRNLNHYKGGFSSEISETVEHLSLPDMARLARAMIDMTSFKRHMQQSDAGTVGGKTEVAVLSKADGFVWIDHKTLTEGN